MYYHSLQSPPDLQYLRLALQHTASRELDCLYPGQFLKVTVPSFLMRFSTRSVVTLVGVHLQCQYHQDQGDITGGDYLLTLLMMFE